MFDVTNTSSLNHTDKWMTDVKKVCGNIPIILTGNKVDVEQREIASKQIVEKLKENLHTNTEYLDISAKSNYNFEKPFLKLARSLTGKNDLQFIEFESILPPIVDFSEIDNLMEEDFEEEEELDTNDEDEKNRSYFIEVNSLTNLLSKL
jgi:GTP-binding nuclear protein Ran